MRIVFSLLTILVLSACSTTPPAEPTETDTDSPAAERLEEEKEAMDDDHMMMHTAALEEGCEALTAL